MSLGENFSGKLIGVADYGVSTPEHTFVLQILSNGPEDPIYLTYNRAKGINIGVPEGQDRVTVVQQAGPSEPSWLLVKLDPIGGATTWTYSNFTEEDLNISLGQPAKDGDIDYIPISVVLGSGEVTDPPTSSPTSFDVPNPGVDPGPPVAGGGGGVCIILF